MKRILIITWFIVLCLNARGQSDSIHIWNKWCRKPDTMLLFMGANNVIEVCSPDLKASDIKFKSLDRNLKISGLVDVKGDTATVMAMPYATDREMKLAIISKKTGKTLKTVGFYGAQLPDLIAYIGSIKGGEVSRDDLLNYINMSITFPNCLYSYPYHIIGYTFKTRYGAKDISIPVTGFWIPPDVQTQIRNAPAGTTVVFTDIKVTCPECAPRTLGDLKIKVK